MARLALSCGLRPQRPYLRARRAAVHKHPEAAFRPRIERGRDDVVLSCSERDLWGRYASYSVIVCTRSSDVLLLY